MDTSSIDLVALVGRDTRLKRVASTQGGEYHGPCPLCGGRDRFAVQANRHGKGGRWSCRECSPHWQDAIDYLKFTRKVTYPMALQELRLEDTPRPVASAHVSPRLRMAAPIATLQDQELPVCLSSMQWLWAADQLVLAAREALWSSAGQSARDYLHNRGLSDGIIASASLGLIPQDLHQPKVGWGIPFQEGDKPNVWLPNGILIPWLLYDKNAGMYKYWRLNIRRFQGEPKYIGPGGSAKGLYGADEIYPGCTVVMTEGEFDALVIRSQALDLLQRRNGIIPVATGSASGAHLIDWLVQIALARKVLLAFDDDEAGDQAAAWWGEKLGSKAKRLRPTQHDVTDMYKAGEDVRAWLLPELR